MSLECQGHLDFHVDTANQCDTSDDPTHFDSQWIFSLPWLISSTVLLYCIKYVAHASKFISAREFQKDEQEPRDVSIITHRGHGITGNSRSTAGWLNGVLHVTKAWWHKIIRCPFQSHITAFSHGIYWKRGLFAIIYDIFRMLYPQTHYGLFFFFLIHASYSPWHAAIAASVLRDSTVEFGQRWESSTLIHGLIHSIYNELIGLDLFNVDACPQDMLAVLHK